MEDIIGSMEETPQTPRLVAASTGTRFLNYLIDVFCFYIILFCFGIVFALFGMLWLFEGAMAYLVAFIFTLLYYIFFEGVFGKTPGKYLTKTSVTVKDGSKPDIMKIMGRTLCRFIPFEAFSFLFSQRGWHDTLSDTWVVKDPKKDSGSS